MHASPLGVGVRLSVSGCSDERVFIPVQAAAQAAAVAANNAGAPGKFLDPFPVCTQCTHA